MKRYQCRGPKLVDLIGTYHQVAFLMSSQHFKHLIYCLASSVSVSLLCALLLGYSVDRNDWCTCCDPLSLIQTSL
jgi:hypothetical protein